MEIVVKNNGVLKKSKTKPTVRNKRISKYCNLIRLKIKHQRGIKSMNFLTK